MVSNEVLGFSNEIYKISFVLGFQAQLIISIDFHLDK